MVKRRKGKPELVGWDSTQRCNLSFPHCYSSATRSPKNELATSECLRIVDSLIDLGTRIICWTGGEPLLRDDLEEIAFHAKSKGNITSGLTTNGILLNEKRAKSLKRAGIDIVQIGLDGSTPEKNRKMRRATEADFWKIIDGIRFCNELGMELDLAMLLGEENLADGPDFIKLTTDLGVKSMRFCGFVPAGRGAGERIKKRLLFSKKLPQLKRFVEQNMGRKEPLVMFDPAFGPLPRVTIFTSVFPGSAAFLCLPQEMSTPVPRS